MGARVLLKHQRRIELYVCGGVNEDDAAPNRALLINGVFTRGDMRDGTLRDHFFFFFYNFTSRENVLFVDAVAPRI